jgi:hypothetical protein
MLFQPQIKHGWTQIGQKIGEAGTGPADFNRKNYAKAQRSYRSLFIVHHSPTPCCLNHAIAHGQGSRRVQ